VIDPTKEAVTLSSFIEHLQEFQARCCTPTFDPYVLIKVGDNWLSVRGNVDHTGEHRNAIQLHWVGNDYISEEAVK
jgi:hypothetical protein